VNICVVMGIICMQYVMYPTTLEECHMQCALGLLPKQLFVLAISPKRPYVNWEYILLYVYGSRQAAVAFGNTFSKERYYPVVYPLIYGRISHFISEFVIVENERSGFKLLQGPEFFQ